ncbi:predicted protein [Histoplasma mississippiense (nom. inval.)]|uniref:predicted protein n=1 Tax=Ajellomyces capsulatus (strain NAm1 / WU24) TaxID=2059318 RepID=UPI000157D462|nr:predicted protein [Histoplasma mississippiense (nom. inval.)]EDN05216.1 predicted protein [Histoplasma mississippiense (nom. inval.)]
MFDSGVIHLIDGLKIDSPLNALTLTHDHHRSFDLEEIDDVRADGSTNLGISPTAKTPKKDTFHVQEVNGPLQGRVTWRSRPIHRT